MFPKLIDNIGITLYKGKIIDNTFLDEIDNKKIITTNGNYDSSKTFEVGKEVGSLIIKILNKICGKENKINLNINETIFNFLIITLLFLITTHITTSTTSIFYK